jgi:hypothetical protein
MKKENFELKKKNQSQKGLDKVSATQNGFHGASGVNYKKQINALEKCG